MKGVIYREPYTYLNYRDLFEKLKVFFLNGHRASFSMCDYTWTLRLIKANGRLKKDRWMLISSDGHVRHYRRLSQVFNYLRSLLGVEPEEESIDFQIKKLINQTKETHK